MSAAVREAIRRLDRWTVTLWLAAPDGADRRGRRYRGKDTVSPLAGPMRGQVVIGSLHADSFTFHRPNRDSVTIRFEQVSMWEPLSPPPTAPLAVEDTPRP